jgi:thioredoxin 1
MVLQRLTMSAAAAFIFVTLSVGQPMLPQTDSSQAIADRIVKSEVPVVVDFWASWCMPCRMLNPIIKDVKKKYGDKIQVIKVNVDVHRALSAYFKVTSIPMVFIINEKTVVQALPGVQPKTTYFAAIDSVLKVSSRSKEKVSPSPSSSAPPGTK